MKSVGVLHVPPHAQATGNGIVIIPPDPNAEPGEWDPFDGRAEAAGFIHIGAMTE